MSKAIHSKEDTDQFKSIIGPRIRAARHALGMTQQDVAEQVSLSTEYFARIERGRAFASVPKLRSIADVLDVSVDYLFGLREYDEPMPATWSDEDPPEITYIVDRARDNPALAKLLLRLVKLCEKRLGHSNDDTE